MNKEIEEMTKDMCRICYKVKLENFDLLCSCENMPCPNCKQNAEAFYNAGYRNIKKLTINEKRALFDLPPIESKENK